MIPLVSIIVLNWNGWKGTIECLESIYKNNYPNYDVILVDNASSDDSITKIKDYCNGKLTVKSDYFNYNPKNKPLSIVEYTEKEIKSIEKNNNLKYDLTLIKNYENYGFAEGNNIGIRYALINLNPDYILLLNNDTVVDKEFLNELVKIAVEDQKIGFAGPKTYYYDFNGKNDVINFAGGKLSLWNGEAAHIGLNEVDRGQYEEIKDVNYVEGSCLLVKSEMIRKIGILDISYFTYWEEIDWCMRGYKEGYKSIYTPKSRIWHKVSSSDISGVKNYYLTRNRIFFMKKYAPTKYLFSFLIYLITFEIFLEIKDFLKNKKSEKFIYFMKGIIDGLRN